MLQSKITMIILAQRQNSKIKTLKDAQTASLFSNELFSEDAEEELEESKNREREKDSMTLADMFK